MHKIAHGGDFVVSEPDAELDVDSQTPGQGEEPITTATIGITESLSLHLEATDDGRVVVEFIERQGNDETPETLYYATKKRDFFTKDQTRKTVANEVAEKCVTISESEAKKAIVDEFQMLSAQATEAEHLFRSPTAEDIVDATGSVDVFVGDTETVYKVEFQKNGMRKTISFDHEQISGSSPRPLISAFSQYFLEKIRIEKEDWEYITDHWFEIAEKRHEENETEEEVIASRIFDKIRERVTPYNDQLALTRDDFNGFYEENSVRDEVNGENVVWMKSTAISQAADDIPGNITNQTLSPIFREKGLTHGPSAVIKFTRNGETHHPRCFPFDANALGIDPEFVQEIDDDRDDRDDGGDDTDKDVVPDGGWLPGDEPDYLPDDGRDDGQPTLMTDGGQVVGTSTDADRAEVVKLNGAPGCGKTTQLFKYLVEEQRDNRLSHEDVYFLTFTVSGKEETKDKLEPVFPEADEEEVRQRAKTVHGAALSACIVNDGLATPREQQTYQALILYDMEQDAYAYRDFCERFALDFSSDESDPLQLVMNGETVETDGNKLFAIYNWLKLERKPLEKFNEAPVGVKFSDRETLQLLREWEAHKQHFYEDPRYEHVDYVDIAIDNGYAPLVDVLFIDEFQDLSPQEYLLFKTWRDSGVIDRIYIAGDQNQSIYSFRSGTPWYFQETPVDREEYVTESYRCPSKIVDVASTALDTCPYTDPQGFHANRQGGSVELERWEHSDPLAESIITTVNDYDLERWDAEDDVGVVLLLARTNYQVGRIGKALNEHGIPYQFLGDDRGRPWTPKMQRFLSVLTALREDRNVPQMTLDEMFGQMTSWTERRERLVELSSARLMGDFYDAEHVWEVFPDCSSVEDFVDAIADLPDWEHRMLVNALESDINPLDPNLVKVGTIHAAKGSQAPNVYLFNSISKRVHDSYASGNTRAEEHRVTYVAATRASERLVVVEDFFQSKYTLPGLNEGLTEVLNQ